MDKHSRPSQIQRVLGLPSLHAMKASFSRNHWHVPGNLFSTASSWLIDISGAPSHWCIACLSSSESAKELFPSVSNLDTFALTGLFFWRTQSRFDQLDHCPDLRPLTEPHPLYHPQTPSNRPAARTAEWLRETLLVDVEQHERWNHACYSQD